MNDKKEGSEALLRSQVKYSAILTADGRYVASNHINVDPIPSRHVTVLDQAAFDAALKAPAVSGPPSIIDRIIDGRAKDYERECLIRQIAIDSANAIVTLSGLPVSDEARSLQKRYILGELTIEEIITATLDRYHAVIQRNKTSSIFYQSELLTEEEIQERLGISPAEFKAAAQLGDLYTVCDAGNILRYPGASANRIARIVWKNKI